MKIINISNNMQNKQLLIDCTYLTAAGEEDDEGRIIQIIQ